MIFSKLFSSKRKTKTSLKLLAKDVFGYSYATSRGTAEKVEELKNIPLVNLTVLLCGGVINYIDRYFYVESQEIRPQLMDDLIGELVEQFGDIFGRDMPAQLTSKQVTNIFTSKLNALQILLGQFKIYAGEGEDSPKNTFLWEFGKIFSEELGGKDDVVLIQLGMNLHSGIVQELNMHSRIDMLKKEYS